jgi:hypothetical protein
MFNIWFEFDILDEIIADPVNTVNYLNKIIHSCKSIWNIFFGFDYTMKDILSNYIERTIGQ